MLGWVFWLGVPREGFDLRGWPAWIGRTANWVWGELFSGPAWSYCRALLKLYNTIGWRYSFCVVLWIEAPCIFYFSNKRSSARTLEAEVFVTHWI